MRKRKTINLCSSNTMITIGNLSLGHLIENLIVKLLGMGMEMEMEMGMKINGKLEWNWKLEWKWN